MTETEFKIEMARIEAEYQKKKEQQKMASTIQRMTNPKLIEGRLITDGYKEDTKVITLLTKEIENIVKSNPKIAKSSQNVMTFNNFKWWGLPPVVGILLGFISGFKFMYPEHLEEVSLSLDLEQELIVACLETLGTPARYNEGILEEEVPFDFDGLIMNLNAICNDLDLFNIPINEINPDQLAAIFTKKHRYAEYLMEQDELSREIPIV